MYIYRIPSEDIEQVLKYFTETEQRLGEYVQMLSCQLDRFEDDAKEILIQVCSLVQQPQATHQFVLRIVESRQGNFV